MEQNQAFFYVHIAMCALFRNQQDAHCAIYVK